MIGPTEQEVLDLVAEYNSLKARRGDLLLDFQWFQLQYPNGVGVNEYIEVMAINPGRKTMKFRVQALMSDIQLSAQIIDQRLPILEKMLFDAGVAIDYQP